MPEERRCDLCKFEKDLPCVNKNCHSGNQLKEFEPKGSEKENRGWSISHITYRKVDDKISINLESKSGNTAVVTLSPDDIVSFNE